MVRRDDTAQVVKSALNLVVRRRLAALFTLGDRAPACFDDTNQDEHMELVFLLWGKGVDRWHVSAHHTAFPYD